MYASHQAHSWQNKCIAPRWLLLFRRNYDQPVEDQSFTYHPSFWCVCVLFSMAVFFFLQLVFQMLEPTCQGRLSTWKDRKCVCRLLKYKSEIFLKAGLSPAGLSITAAVLSANALLGVFRSESFGYFKGYIVPKKFHLKLTNLSHGLKCGIRNTNISITTEFCLPVSQMRAFSTPWSTK